PPRRLQRPDARRHAERRRNGARSRRRAVQTRRHHGGASASRTRRIIPPFVTPGANTMKLLVAVASMLSLAGLANAQLAPPNAAGISYGHVHLNVKDVELQKKLWVDHFGGVVVQKGPLTAIKLPNMLIAFRQAEPTGGSEGSVMDHFGFKVRNIAEALQAWRAAGYPVGRQFPRAGGFPKSHLYRPDNLKIEVQEDKTLAVKAAPNHIHFMTPEYVKLLDWYADMFSLAKRARGTIPTTADAPGLNLTFATSESPTVGTKGRAIDHIGF